MSEDDILRIWTWSVDPLGVVRPPPRWPTWAQITTHAMDLQPYCQSFEPSSSQDESAWAMDLEGVVRFPLRGTASFADPVGLYDYTPVDPDASSWGDSDGSQADRWHWGGRSTSPSSAQGASGVPSTGSSRRTLRGEEPLCYTCGLPRSGHSGGRFCDNCTICGRPRREHPDGRYCTFMSGSEPALPGEHRPSGPALGAARHQG